MRTATATLILLGLAGIATVDAQGRGRRSQAIPPGHLPPPGQCRVWYDNLPPGRQPASTDCDRAERIASRDRDARVIYGDRTRDNRRWQGDDDRSDRSALGDRIRERIRNRGAAGANARYNSAAFTNGERDGYEKGREDARDNDSYDPVRHSRYRSADRGYESSYGTRDAYKLTYRDGFESGYDRGYREVRGYGATRNRAGGLR